MSKALFGIAQPNKTKNIITIIIIIIIIIIKWILGHVNHFFNKINFFKFF